MLGDCLLAVCACQLNLVPLQCACTKYIFLHNKTGDERKMVMNFEKRSDLSQESDRGTFSQIKAPEIKVCHSF